MTTEEKRELLRRMIHIKTFNQCIAPALKTLGLDTSVVDWEKSGYDDKDVYLSGKFIIKRDNIKWIIKARPISDGGARISILGVAVVVYDNHKAVDGYDLRISIDKLTQTAEILKVIDIKVKENETKGPHIHK